MDEAKRIADLLWQIALDAINGGDLKTVDHLGVVLPPAEAQRAKDLALIVASQAINVEDKS